MNQPDPERWLLCQDIFWRLVSNPGFKHDQGNLETACDVAFLSARIYYARLKEEKQRIETLERDMLRDQLAHELASQPNDQNTKGQKRRRPNP